MAFFLIDSCLKECQLVSLSYHPHPNFSATPELVTAPPSFQQDQAVNEAQAIASVSLDYAQPVTNIQIRLADGGRLVQKFNHTHR